MGHFVTGLVAQPKQLEEFAEKHSLHKPIALTQGLSILPLRDEDLDAFLKPPMIGHPEGFTYLSEQLVNEVAPASESGAILYFETEYFGGTGAQGAAVFSKGSLVFGPKSAESGPINEALRVLGVKVTPPAFDEFEAIGLNRHRHTEDWLEISE